MIDFFKFMALDEFDDRFITKDISLIISEYIQNTNTATKFSEIANNGSVTTDSKTRTSEEIYALMFSAGVPLEFENRNLNRLLTILRVISVQSGPKKKMTKEEVLKQNAVLNKQRKAAMNTNG